MRDDLSRGTVKGGVAPSSGTPHSQALYVAGVSKSFGGKVVLHPLSLAIQPGEIHMLLGQNGSGKSTLIKVLAGYHRPDTLHEFAVGGRSLPSATPDAVRSAGLRFVHQDLGLIATETVADNVLLANGYATSFGTIKTKSMLAVVRQSLRSAGLGDIDPYALVERLTPAQRTGVAIARAIVPGEHNVAALVLDEPTATLPPYEVIRLHEILKRATDGGVGVLYVTHHLDEVKAIADRITILRDGKVVKSSSAAGTSRETIVEHLLGGSFEVADRAPIHRTTASTRTRLQIKGLVGEHIHGMTFTAYQSEVLGFFGLTGSGRETLLATVFGAIPKESGTVAVAGDPPVEINNPSQSIRAGVAYVPPDRKAKGGFMELTASENIALTDLKPFWRRGFLSKRAEFKHVSEWFRRIDIRPADGVDRPLSAFSGGNQQKILMAKWLRLRPPVLLLDEPTQGVDVGAKAELHRLILQARDGGAAVLVSSTDVEELVALCDRVLVVDQGQIKQELTAGEITEQTINASLLASFVKQE